VILPRSSGDCNYRLFHLEAIAYISVYRYSALMHAFDILGDPVRRRILELLADGERSAGEVGSTVQAEFGISQPAVSQHLRVLRDNGFATVRAAGTRRLYALDADPLRSVDEWLVPYRRFWNQRLDALGTELARGKRQPSKAQSEPAATASAVAENPSKSRRKS
jgi:DNA-binding transcriptional ArsR family regulator